MVWLHGPWCKPTLIGKSSHEVFIRPSYMVRLHGPWCKPALIGKSSHEVFIRACVREQQLWHGLHHKADYGEKWRFRVAIIPIARDSITTLSTKYIGVNSVADMDFYYSLDLLENKSNIFCSVLTFAGTGTLDSLDVPDNSRENFFVEAFAGTIQWIIRGRPIEHIDLPVRI